MTTPDCQIKCTVRLTCDPIDGATKSGVVWCNALASIIGTGKAAPDVHSTPDDLKINLVAFGTPAECLRKYSRGAELKVRGTLTQKFYNDRDGKLQCRLELQIEILQGPHDLEPVTHSEKSTTRNAANDTYAVYRGAVGNINQ